MFLLLLSDLPHSKALVNYKYYSGTGTIRLLSFATSYEIGQKIYGPKVFLLTKIKPEYSDILYNTTHFPGPFVCRIRQVPLYEKSHLMYTIETSGL